MVGAKIVTGPAPLKLFTIPAAWSATDNVRNSGVRLITWAMVKLATLVVITRAVVTVCVVVSTAPVVAPPVVVVATVPVRVFVAVSRDVGINSLSITWIKPFDAGTSGRMIVALFTRTCPFAVRVTVTVSPSAVNARPNWTKFASVTRSTTT